MNLTFDFQVQLPSFTLQAAGSLQHPVIGIFGPSGSGKTTFLNVIAGLTRAHKGTAQLDELTLFGPGLWLPPHRRQIAVVFQDARLFPHLSVEKNLRYGESLTPHTHRRFSFQQVVDTLSISHLLDRRTPHLSGGERQRIALGRALLSSPRLLCLDEPLSALDLQLKHQLIPFLQKIRDDFSLPMLLVSHDLNELLQLTQQLLLFENGALLGAGSYLSLTQEQNSLGMLHAMGLRNVLHVRLQQQHPHTGASILQHLDAPELILHAPALQTQTPQTLHISIRPEDISLALHRHEALSIQNQCPGKVVRLLQHQNRRFVEVDIGCPVLVELTQQAIDDLSITPGLPVWCLIKSQAISTLSPSHPTP